MISQRRLLQAGIVSLVLLTLATPGAEIELTLQSRDPATGRIILSQEKVDPIRVGVIAVDVWNFHWCKTATMRVDAIVPRMNKALDAARELGMTVMLCPSDVVDNYVGYPQREAVFALPPVTVPTVMEVTCPPVPDAGLLRSSSATPKRWCSAVHRAVAFGPRDGSGGPSSRTGKPLRALSM